MQVPTVYRHDEFNELALVLEFPAGDDPHNVSTNKERLDKFDTRLSSIETALRLGPKTQGWLAKAWDWIVAHKRISGLLAILLTVAGWFASGLYQHHLDHADQDFNLHVDARVDGKLGDVNKKLSDMNEKLTTIGTTLNTLQPFIQDLVRHQMDKAAALSQDEFQNNLPAIEHVVFVAKEQHVLVDSAIVQKVGKKLITAAHNNVGSWNAALNIMDYRSLLNASEPIPTVRDARSFQASTHPTRINAPNPWLVDIEYYGQHDGLISTKFVPVEAGAHYEHIGENLNAGKKFAPDLIVLDGRKQTASFHLDDYWLKNVIIRNARIVYDSGPILLQNVYFVNCTFQVSPGQRGQKFADAILSVPSVTLSVSTSQHG